MKIFLYYFWFEGVMVQKMVTEGIEPSTVALLAQRSNQLSYATFLTTLLFSSKYIPPNTWLHQSISSSRTILPELLTSEQIWLIDIFFCQQRNLCVSTFDGLIESIQFDNQANISGSPELQFTHAHLMAGWAPCSLQGVTFVPLSTNL